MHATARGLIRAAQRPILRDPCRIIGGARYPPPYRPRTFHQSTIFHSVANESKPPKDDSGIESTPIEVEEVTAEETKAEETKAEEDTTDSVSVVADQPILSQRGRTARNARLLRLNRQKQPEGLPPVHLPEWFWLGNINPEYGRLSRYAVNEADGGISRTSQEVGHDCRYSVHSEVFAEVETSIKAALNLRPPKNHASNSAVRPTLVLQCPKEGGMYFLDSIIGTVASDLNAHVIRLDAGDIARIVGPYIDENLAWNRSTTALFGYNTQEQAGRLEEYDKFKPDTPEEENSEEDDTVLPVFAVGGNVPGKSGSFPNVLPFMQNLNRSMERMKSARSKLDSFKLLRDLRGDPRLSPPISFGRAEAPLDLDLGSPMDRPRDSQSQWSDLKLTTALEALVDSVDKAHAYDMNLPKGEQEESITLGNNGEEVAKKRMEKAHRLSRGSSAGNLGGNAESQSSPLDPGQHPVPPINVIVQIADYKELGAIEGGSQCLGRLQDVVNKRWREGRNIILVGTTSSSEPDGPTLEKSEIQILQEDIVEGETRTVYVPPERSEAQDLTFAKDKKHRIQNINISHVNDMLEKLREGTQMECGVSVLYELDSAVVFSSGMEDAVWTYARVHRLASTMLGSLSPAEAADPSFVIDGRVLKRASDILSRSDEVKFKWGEEELKKDDKPLEEVVLNAEETAKKQARENIEAVKKTCNRYEQGLLHGIVLPSSIKTTFDDIRAPKATIEALKSLTSLSLQRPDAFSYGVLLTEKISGLLLYGPPGTGKTLLAKAVAKESGATVLEVTAAELNAMFVGESEKNVRAVFTLARKLSPCVVFIDEVDSIFTSRENSRNRTGQRALLNQFLRELDGMNDLSTFIMVATNRPFDLDDAILRRLPRRLLVDLPNQEDREEILKIQLKNEVLDADVSLERLAKDTPFYSGSDLKHVVVTAAINATLDENKLAALHTGEEPYKYPEKRTLTPAHFTKALEEISASISEDMGSLRAIKKFDEKYGDRKGRRKKGPSMGFGGTKTVEKDSESARVRKSVPAIEET